ncbi:MAG: SDR family oxidoreductase, partial [Niameybacter sp.]
AIGELKKHKESAIVNIGSDLGVRPIPERIGYCPSKAAVMMLTKCIAMEYAPQVRANCLLPGLVETPMIRERFEQAEDPAALRTEFANLYPMKRMGTLEDMASTALFLMSGESSFITGEVVGVCGGSLI